MEKLEDDDFEETVTLTLDDDTEVECAIIATFPVGDKEYIALLPLGGEEEENGEVFIYRYFAPKDDDSEPGLENIEDDDEYEAAADAFDELLDNSEYDEIVSEEDL